MISTYTKLGKGAGFIVHEEDLKYNPLSVARASKCWIGENGRFSVLDWGLGDAINIPERHYWKMVGMERDKELGEDLIKRYLKKLT